MGKVRRRKPQSASLATNPLEDLVAPESLPPFPVMQQVEICNLQLNSEDDREKEQACRTISTLVLDETEGPQALELLIAHSGLQNLLQLLMVPDQEVRVAAAGALRNVSLAGAEQVATKLVNLDCLTLLFDGILLPLGQTAAQTNPEFLIHTLSLLSNLAEADERVAQRFAGSTAQTDPTGSNLFNSLVGLLLDPGTCCSPL